MALWDESTIAPEQAIVLYSIRVDRARDDRILESLTGRLDWESLRRYALRQGALPLLYRRLKSLDDGRGADLVPGQEMEQLQALYLANAQRNLRLTRMNLRVVDLLSREHIPCLPVKGPLLAAQIYGDIAMRHFTDLDILIHASDFQRCYQTLISAGFTPQFPLTRPSETWLLRADSEFQFSYQEDLLEIHWGIAERGVQYPLTEDRLWEQLHPVDLQGRRILSLSIENLFLMLCMHGTKHMWGRLNWVSDMAYFVTTYPDLDWRAVLDNAGRDGLRRVVCLGLHLAESWGGAQLPPDISTRVHEDPKTEALARIAFHRLVDEAPVSEQTQVNYYLRSRERTRDRAYYILDQAFLPKQVDWMTLSLPAAFYPLYFLFRPMRLLFKFVFSPWAAR